MKKNIKLFFTTLISNNAAIDAGRKKPWYAAIILFFIGLVLSVVPTFSLEMAKHADKNFKTTTYSLREALTMFSEELAKDEHANDMYVIKQDKKTSTLANYETINYECQVNKAFFHFVGATKAEVPTKLEQLKALKGSYIVFTSDTVYFHIVDPNDINTTKLEYTCVDAYKKVGKDDFRNAFVKSDDLQEQQNKTWENWKGLIRKLYNQTRVRIAMNQLLVICIVNVGIYLIMGFMVWVLTRGKNNPYRMFNVWECYKICFWTGFSPALLTCGAGFLLRNFASTIFPLLLGVRVMWLSMKSLRPDGSGYAAN